MHGECCTFDLFVVSIMVCLSKTLTDRQCGVRPVCARAAGKVIQDRSRFVGWIIISPSPFERKLVDAHVVDVKGSAPRATSFHSQTTCGVPYGICHQTLSAGSARAAGQGKVKLPTLCRMHLTMRWKDFTSFLF